MTLGSFQHGGISVTQELGYQDPSAMLSIVVQYKPFSLTLIYHVNRILATLVSGQL